MSMLRELTRNRKADAALENERVTRGRVDVLERSMRAHGQQIGDMNHILAADVLALLYDRSFWGRLKWLVLGK